MFPFPKHDPTAFHSFQQVMMANVMIVEESDMREIIDEEEIANLEMHWTGGSHPESLITLKCS